MLAIIVASIAMVALYKYIPIPITPLMLTRHISEGEPIHYQWTPLEKISPGLPLAVVASEDNLFASHNGFDFEQIRIAQAEAAQGKRLRGASTISQQTAKNIFLWNGRSWLRKGLEVYFTLLIEGIWGKRRIMEVYLNCIEMGKGIYGATAVAEKHFGKHPSELTRAECALIAATLPNPRLYSSKKPSKYMRQRQNAILRNMRNIGKVEYEKK